MLFDYKIFIDSLRRDSDKKECIERYERYIEPIGKKSLRNEKWYIELVKRFEYVNNILYPSKYSTQFDWNLLIQLGASSLSSDLGFKKVCNDFHLIFRVVSGDSVVIKSLDDLYEFQILRLYEIYIEEQINLCGLCYEQDRERRDIYSAKKVMLEDWNDKILELKDSLQRA